MVEVEFRNNNGTIEWRYKDIEQSPMTTDV